jgi:hypothetical protein
MHKFTRLRKQILVIAATIFATLAHSSFAQNDTLINEPISTITSTQNVEKLKRQLKITEEELDRLTDIRAIISKENEQFSTPFAVQKSDDNLLRLIKKEVEEPQLSEEALYWARLTKDYTLEIPYGTTFDDMMIVDPMFLPLVFKGEFYPKKIILHDFYWQKEPVTAYSNLYPLDSTLFDDELKKEAIREIAYRYVEKNHPEVFNYSKSDLISDIPKSSKLRKTLYENLLEATNDATFDSITSLETYIPKRKYWIPHFESAIQFSQSYLSPNWHKGGEGNVNLFTRNYFSYNYNREKIQIVNEFEWKASFYTAPKDTLHEYRIGDDVVRLHTNVGYKAFDRWFYTFDGEFRTQMFSNYATNSDNILAGFLAPFNINIGLGMKYELARDSKTDKYNKLRLSVNLAPLSLNYMYTRKDDIDLPRHGFKDGKHYLTKLGSTVKANLVYNINRNLSWQSNFNYFTSYDRITAEFENTFNIAISRFFSTRFYLNLRFDDGIALKDDFKSHIQVSEILSFGFNYKW